MSCTKGLTPTYTDVKQLANRRFFLWQWPSREWWIGIGFSFASDETLEYPTIRMQIEVSDRAKPASRHQIIAAMREIGTRPAWISYNLSAARMWSGVLREQSLRTLLSGDDHVAEMRAVCFNLLSELATIKHQFPHLPWGNGTLTTPPEEE